MALEATHIRFALDLKDKYQVRDIKRYVSGSIYPDSRYVTKIDRVLTHPEDFLNEGFTKNDDFRKGWQAHLLCDKVQSKVTIELLPSAFEGQMGQGGVVWIKITALKILQDLDDVKQFPITEYLECLDYTENAKGEELDKIKKYYYSIKNLYQNPSSLSLDSYKELLKLYGISDDLALKVKNQAEFYARDENNMQTVLRIYPEIIVRSNNIL